MSIKNLYKQMENFSNHLKNSEDSDILATGVAQKMAISNPALLEVSSMRELKKVDVDLHSVIKINVYMEDEDISKYVITNKVDMFDLPLSKGDFLKVTDGKGKPKYTEEIANTLKGYKVGDKSERGILENADGNMKRKFTKLQNRAKGESKKNTIKQHLVVNLDKNITRTSTPVINALLDKNKDLHSANEKLFYKIIKNDLQVIADKIQKFKDENDIQVIE
ncbi:MAG: hypothetical protein Tp1100SUR639781_35 [Prokaryotic dsDNA virus sp.]|jgi:hypothetical protein|nr:MAG: hypothetical protein Tp1100SUR639781_35 [Prokaryotic dsDNA virus sp.]|tara:strand:+ start:2506 stop:3168 length:663 start_codon:yes stop_codon:yes gene_type:complete